MARKDVQAPTNVTSLDSIKAQVAPIVELPGFTDEPLFVRLKRPSLLGLIQNGAIPNHLLPMVQDLVMEGKVKAQANAEEAGPEQFKLFCEMIDAVCKAALVEPTYEEIGDYLTDSQKTGILMYVQLGAKALDSFRKGQDAIAQGFGNS
jgi:hypothetical protein